MSRRSARLDRFLNRLVDITFHDGQQGTGVLEFGMQPSLDRDPVRQYSLFVFGSGYKYFYKSQVSKIREHF